MSNESCKIAGFETDFGTEFFFAFEAPVGLDFAGSVGALLEEYDELLTDSGLGVDTEVYLRFHLSDIANQARPLVVTLGSRAALTAISLVGQPPVSGSKIALTGYHVRSKEGIRKERISSETLAFHHGGYKTMFATCRPSGPGSSYQQTQQVFGQLTDVLKEQGATLQGDVIRTWLFVRDVDNNYRGMVDARRELFETVGMNRDTHYIASTGIDGVGSTPSDLVLLDALSVTGLKPGQITYMNALENLCPTHRYNVTFERGTRIVYGDRAHFYISGTASISKEGKVLHPGNVEQQAGRTLGNVRALLTNYGADIEDLKILVVYLRDPSDVDVARSFLKANLPASVPFIIVRGAVCRSSWLIEMEGIAVTGNTSPEFEPFCR